LPTTPPDWVGIAETTRRGFTSHEMLDNVGLIHMNGRVYDPAVGRFLSVDPLIGSMADSQSVNPFAYAGNRPLNGVDPSGLCLDCGIGIIIGIGFDFGGMFGGHRLPPPPARAGTSAQTSINVCDPGMSSPSCGGAGATGFSKSLVLGQILEASPGAPAGPCAECNHGNVGDFIVGLLAGAVDSATYSIVYTIVSGGPFTAPNPFLHEKADEIARYISIGRPNSNLGELGYDLGPILPLPGIGAAATWAIRGDKLIARGHVVLGEQVGAQAAGAAKSLVQASRWPPNRGFDGTPTSVTLSPGTHIDRYGSELGTFASPAGTPFSSRSLPPDAARAALRSYEVLKPLPARGGPATPWFGQLGGGTQYELEHSIESLVHQGFLRRIP
jgi:RHS repeat-associated protein